MTLMFSFFYDLLYDRSVRCLASGKINALVSRAALERAIEERNIKECN